MSMKLFGEASKFTNFTNSKGDEYYPSLNGTYYGTSSDNGTSIDAYKRFKANLVWKPRNAWNIDLDGECILNVGNNVYAFDNMKIYILDKSNNRWNELFLRHNGGPGQIRPEYIYMDRWN